MQTDSTLPAATCSRYQYSLWHLLVLIAVAGAGLGAWRLLGVWIFLAPVAAAVAILPALWHPRWLYVWLLPLVWTCVAWTNFYHPGDEYGGFAAGSLAGLWIMLIAPPSGSPINMLPPVLLAGALTMAIAGLLMDWLRVRWVVWIVLLLGAAMQLFAWSFGSYPSVARALSKNGSLLAYIMPSINLSIYFATVTMLVVTSVYRGARWIWKRRVTDNTLTMPLQ